MKLNNLTIEEIKEMDLNSQKRFFRKWNYCSACRQVMIKGEEFEVIVNSSNSIEELLNRIDRNHPIHLPEISPKHLFQLIDIKTEKVLIEFNGRDKEPSKTFRDALKYFWKNDDLKEGTLFRLNFYGDRFNPSGINNGLQVKFKSGDIVMFANFKNFIPSFLAGEKLVEIIL